MTGSSKLTISEAPLPAVVHGMTNPGTAIETIGQRVLSFSAPSVSSVSSYYYNYSSSLARVGLMNLEKNNLN